MALLVWVGKFLLQDILMPEYFGVAVGVIFSHRLKNPKSIPDFIYQSHKESCSCVQIHGELPRKDKLIQPKSLFSIRKPCRQVSSLDL